MSSDTKPNPKHINTIMDPTLFKELKKRAIDMGLNMGDFINVAVILTRGMSRDKVVKILKNELQGVKK